MPAILVVKPREFNGPAKEWMRVLDSLQRLKFPVDEVADFVAMEKMVENPGSTEVWSCIIDLTDADIEKMLVKEESINATP